MEWQRALQKMQIEERRQQRNEQKRQREIERRLKEQAKLSALEQARLEVEKYESDLEVLLSVHKNVAPPVDWHAAAASFSPVAPQRLTIREFKARLQLVLSDQQAQMEPLLAEERRNDDLRYEEQVRAYDLEMTEWRLMTGLARRIISGDTKAYTEALVELNPFEEISHLGSSLDFAVHNPRVVECWLKVNGRQVIPSETKSLTASGKLSVKTMPKGQFHEIYQDYVCACILRVSREIASLLPVDQILVTASADEVDSRTGQTIDQPVLSVVFTREQLARLNYEHLDPSDAIESLLHRGNFKASRKHGAFQSISPFAFKDLPPPSSEAMDLPKLVERAKLLRAELRSEVAEAKTNTTPVLLNT